MAEKEKKIRMSPKTCAYVDTTHALFIMEVSLPGVNKKDIDLRMHDESFYLSAPREENVEYVSALSLAHPVKAKDAKATYENGLLRIEAPFKETVSNAVKVKVD